MAFNLSLSNVNQGSPVPLSTSLLNHSEFDDYQTRNHKHILANLNDLSFKSDPCSQNLETSKFAANQLHGQELTLADERDSSLS